MILLLYTHLELFHLFQIYPVKFASRLKVLFFMQQRCLEFLYYISSCFLKRNYDQTNKPQSTSNTFKCFLWVGICIELLVVIFVFSYSTVCFWCLIKILKPKSMGLWYQWISGKCISGEVLVMFCFAFSTSAFEVEVLKLWFDI